MLFNFNNILPYDGQVSLTYNFLPDKNLSTILSYFDLEEHSISLFGKKVLVPRLVDYQGELDYEYSGNCHPKKDVHPEVRSILNQIIDNCKGFEFNSILANYYRDGKDSMGYHADDEPEIDSSVIASLSFGEERRMLFKHIKTKELIKVDLPSNTLMVMKNCQCTWQHAIPKTSRKIGERLNLTFRKVL